MVYFDFFGDISLVQKQIYWANAVTFFTVHNSCNDKTSSLLFSFLHSSLLFCTEPPLSTEGGRVCIVCAFWHLIPPLTLSSWNLKGWLQLQLPFKNLLLGMMSVCLHFDFVSHLKRLLGMVILIPNQQSPLVLFLPVKRGQV